MKEDAQRIAIAEASGWTCCSNIPDTLPPHGWPPNARKPTTAELLNGTAPEPYDLPDYLNDLNAMHEAMKSRTVDEQYIILGHLCVMWGEEEERPYHMAEASEWAEAFLRTLNLWTDE